MKYLFKQPLFYTSLLALLALGLVIGNYAFGNDWHTPTSIPPSGNVNLTSSYESTIATGTASQYWRGDKTWQTLPPDTDTWITTQTCSTDYALQSVGKESKTCINKVDYSDIAYDLSCTDCIGTTEIADSYVLNTGDAMTGALAMGANKITGLGTPTAGTDAATMSYADSAVAAKANIASPTFTGVVAMPTPFTLGGVSVTATGAELNFVDGVTSAIQTQFTAKAPLASPTFTGTVAITGDLNVTEPLASTVNFLGTKPADVATTPATAAAEILDITGPAGGNTTIATTGVGGIGSGISWSMGAGGTAASAVTSSQGGAGGAIGFTAGTGAAAAAAGIDIGGAGGAISLTAGTGGAATVGTSLTGGAGGAITIAAGAAGAGGNANGGTLTLRSGARTGTGTSIINIGTSNTTAITIGNATTNPTVTFTGTGTVTIPTPFTLGAVSVVSTGTELNYLDGVTSAIQTQFTAKAPLASPTFTGSVTAPAFYYSSDESLKKNIQKIETPLAKIMKLDGVSFDWKESGNKSIGLIAQSVEKVFPEIVKTDKETGLKSIEYAKLVAPLIEAIKEQQKMIDEQKVLINQQGEEIKALKVSFGQP